MLNQTIHVVTCLIFLYFLFSVLLDNVLLLYGEGTYSFGNEKVIDLFPFLVPKQSTLNQKHWKESLSFSSFIYFFINH